MNAHHRWSCRALGALTILLILHAGAARAGSPEPPADPPTPIVCIRVRVPAMALPGEDLEYHICVENPSPAPAHHVVVRNPIPPQARFVRAKPAPTAREPELIWELGTLDACTQREIVLVLSPTGADDVKNCARVQFEHGQCVCTKVPKPALELKKEGPSHGLLNETLTFKLTVTNCGEADAHEVKLTDSLPIGLEHSTGKRNLLWHLGTLAPGRSRTVEYQVVAKAVGKQCNQAVVVAEGGIHEEIERCVTVSEAKLAISKVGPTKRYINLPATYEFTVTNEGSATLTNVTITDPLPEGATFVSASDNGNLSEQRVQWSLGTLEPAESRTVHVVLRAQGAGNVCNRVTATADHGILAKAEICTEFVGYAALLLEVVDTDDPVELDGETAYIIYVRNQGHLPATNVVVTAHVPRQEQVVGTAGPSEHKQEGQRLSFLPVTIPPRGEVRYTITVRAAEAGDVRFRVTLTADALTSGPVEEEESTTLYAEPPAVRGSR
jgi:uncharacterized repeat protein (TIGR01451 family)